MCDHWVRIIYIYTKFKTIYKRKRNDKEKRNTTIMYTKKGTYILVLIYIILEIQDVTYNILSNMDIINIII